MSLKDTIKKNKFVIGGLLGGIVLILIVVAAFVLLGSSDEDEGEVIDDKVKVCSAGEFLKRGKCVECDAGTYSESNATECITCAAGRYSAAGSDKCSICGVGTSSKIGSETCDTCSAGTYATAGSAECTKCSVGQVSGDGAYRCEWTCEDGQVPNYATNECSTCPVGTYSKDYGKVCISCPSAQYAPVGSSHCYACEPGMIVNSDQSACKNCPVGTYSNDNMPGCQSCPSAQYAPVGSSQCYACEPGMIVNSDQSACKNCDAGKYLNATRGYCEPCPEGSYSDGGGGDCTYCSDGKAGVWGLNGGKTTEEEACTLCPANYYIEGPNGPYFTGSKNRICAYCTYVDGIYSLPGSDPQGCGMCNTGKYLNQDGSCAMCPENTYISAGVSKGLGICLDNPLPENDEDCVNIESYDAAGVSTACIPCAVDFISAPGSGVCKSIYCQIKDDSHSLWNEYELVTQTGGFLDILRGFNDIFAAESDFSDINAKACDLEFLTHVKNDNLQMLPYTPTEIEVFESMTEEKLKVFNFIGWIIRKLVDEDEDDLEEWLQQDIDNLKDGFTLNKEFSITPSGNLCTRALLQRPLDWIRWWGNPYWLANIFGQGCKRLNKVDFEGVYKRMPWYSAFVHNSILWNNIYSNLRTQTSRYLDDLRVGEDSYVLKELRSLLDDDDILPAGLKFQKSPIPPIPSSVDDDYLTGYLTVVILSGGLMTPYGTEWGLLDDDSLLVLITGMSKMYYNMHTLKQIYTNCEGANCTNDGGSSVCTQTEDKWGEEILADSPGC
jgi:hypothetical protein